MVLRHVKEDIPSIEDLGLPPVVKDLALRPSGLILVSGPTGSGKTTSLAAMIDVINSERRCHILTIEDPIEFMPPGNSPPSVSAKSTPTLWTSSGPFARACVKTPT